MQRWFCRKTEHHKSKAHAFQPLQCFFSWFHAWDKVRGEFLNTLKRLMNLDYENIILISHEDTSKDITRKGGDKITAIKPNLQEKVANKVAGMVDVVARIVADGDARTFSFKSNEVIFGGGRLKVNALPGDSLYLQRGFPLRAFQLPFRAAVLPPFQGLPAGFSVLYVEAGFTQEQAFELVKGILTAKKN